MAYELRPDSKLGEVAGSGITLNPWLNKSEPARSAADRVKCATRSERKKPTGRPAGRRPSPPTRPWPAARAGAGVKCRNDPQRAQDALP